MFKINKGHRQTNMSKSSSINNLNTSFQLKDNRAHNQPVIQRAIDMDLVNEVCTK